MSRHSGRREFLKRSGSAGLGLALLPLPRVESAPTFDLVIHHGLILDGTGGPAFVADVGVQGDTIAELGTIPAEQGRRVLDASGLHVAPGFIDVHTHSDESILRYPTADSRVRQGITTEVTGNCGSSMAPLEGRDADERRADFFEEYGVEATWTDVGSYFRTLEELRISVNHAMLLGHGDLRRSVAGLEDRPLTEDEQKLLLRAVEQGMDEGAIGLSTGLEYTPGRYAHTEEIVALARVVARRGGLYATHMRDEAGSLLEAVHEAIEIGRRAGARVSISHLKAAGRPHWSLQPDALRLIEDMRGAGVDVRADAYPYTAYSTGLTIFLPGWALDGGRQALAARLADAGERSRIRDEVAANVGRDPGGFELIVISSVRGEANRGAVGQPLDRIAAGWAVDPAEALLRLVAEEEGAVSFVGHGMSPENVERVLTHPLVMIGSDGRSMAPEGPLAKTRPHPRSYGTCARVLGHYSRERKVLDLPTAVEKMTRLPADQVGLRDRGRIAKGMKADLTLFDAATVADQATFDDPHRYPIGIQHVIVNGVLVVEDGAHTGARPGRVLRS